MDYSIFAVLLLIVALGLLVAEVFIPSGGIILTVAVLCLAGSLWCAWNAWWGTSPAAWWTYIGSILVLIPVAVGGAFWIFPRTAFGRRILLEAPDLEEVSPYAKERQRLSRLVGQPAKTLTLLNPGGLVLVGGERMHCESEGMLIDPGEQVTIVGVKGNRLVVRVAALGEPPPGELQSQLDDSEKPPLDFDLPQS